MTSLHQKLFAFWSQFTHDGKPIPAYYAGMVPNNAQFPYITFSVSRGDAFSQGINTAFVTLHVGLGTFRPVKADQITDHHMHSELCMISSETAELLNQTRAAGGRIICVGTTSCRTLESLVKEDGTFEAASKWTEIFIYPGYRFKAMQGLITNFHLPESTLVMLVSAFAGRENVLAAYEEAVRERYRFFSFGDAMLIADTAVPGCN